MKKSCFHIRFDKPCGYGEKLKRLQFYVCQTFGKLFFLFFFFFFVFFFFFCCCSSSSSSSFFFLFYDNFTGSKDTEPYKRDVSFFVSVYIIHL